MATVRLPYPDWLAFLTDTVGMSQPQPEIEIGPETENAQGWRYEVNVFAYGKVQQFKVSLSFADYDLWSRGAISPSRVVERVVEFLLKHDAIETISERFDCSTVRRRFPDIDRELPGRLGVRRESDEAS